MEASLLHVLRCYVCFRPHVGYTQGMSYIAGVLLLNMDEKTAFRCFANLLNRPGLEDLFRLKKEAFDMFVHTFDYFFERLLPYLHYHLKREKVQSEMFLMDWILSLFAKALSLEATARLWDKFLFEGEVGIVRGALGLLRYLAPQLAVLSIEGIVKLLINTKNVDPDELMHHVQIISQVLPIEKFEKIRERFYYSKVSPRQNSIRILTESLRSMQSRAYNAFNSFTSPYPHSPPNNSPSYYKTDSPGSPGAQQVTNDVPISLRLSPKSSVGTAANGSVLSSTVQKEYRLSPSKMEGESSQKLNSANNCLIS